MGVDGIGKGGGVPPRAPGAGGPPEASPAQGSTSAGKPFEVDRGGASEPAAPVAAPDRADPASPLGRLRAGEVDVHGYIDLRVDEATRSLRGLSAEEIDAIKSTLRDQLRTDPALVDLVREATGQTPSPPRDTTED